MSFTSRLSLGGRKRGALSAVTGGHPEDMNGMPPDINPKEDAPVYDGADLSPKGGLKYWKFAGIAVLAVGALLTARQLLTRGAQA